MDSAKEQVKEQVVANKKMLYILGAVVIFGGYMLYPTASPVETDGGVDDELANLQASRSGTPSTPQPRFSGTDQRNISLGGGGSDTEDRAAFETQSPVVRGIFVGYGVKSDSKGQYLSAYIKDGEVGFEIDLRDVTGYSIDPPKQWTEGSMMTVYGTKKGEWVIRARSVR